MARPEKFPVKKVIGFDQETLDGIDAYRRTETPIPNVSDAIRTIIRDWLRSKSFLPK